MGVRDLGSCPALPWASHTALEELSTQDLRFPQRRGTYLPGCWQEKGTNEKVLLKNVTLRDDRFVSPFLSVARGVWASWLPTSEAAIRNT